MKNSQITTDQINEILKKLKEIVDASSYYIYKEQEIKKIRNATEQDFKNDRATFKKHVERLRIEIAGSRIQFMDQKLINEHNKILEYIMLEKGHYLTWLGNDWEIIGKLIHSGYSPKSLKSFHFLDLDSIVNNLLELENTNGIKLLIAPIFQSILVYNFHKIRRDITMIQEAEFNTPSRSKQIDSASRYITNISRRIKSNGGILLKYTDKVLDHMYLNLIAQVKEENDEIDDIGKALKKIVSTNTETKILGSTIYNSILFDEVTFPGDKKYEVIFDLYKDVLKEDFLLKEEHEVDKLEGYSNYGVYKRNYIKTSIFKKRNVLNGKDKDK